MIAIDPALPDETEVPADHLEWQGEPAALKALIVSLVGTALAIVTGSTTGIDGGNAIALAIAAFVVPIVQGFWTRRSVSPVAK